MTKYKPYSYEEGRDFESDHCERCKHDAEWRLTQKNGCSIHTRGQGLSVEDEGFPTEWTYKDGNPTCTAFEKVDESLVIHWDYYCSSCDSHLGAEVTVCNTEKEHDDAMATIRMREKELLCPGCGGSGL